MIHRKPVILLTIIFSIFLIPIIQAEAASNPNLFVSAENSQFNNHFSGSMVIEVVIRDPNLQDTDQGKGEPDVTLNGNSLRMVQSTDGNWYAYFANVDKAKVADSTQSATSGKGLDFGVFCSRDTSSSVFGISLSETDGFTVPRNNGLSGFTNGDSSFNQCTGTLTSSTNLNNVIRNAKSINTNPNIPSGQIGLDSDAWPLIQLYSFSTGGNVVIQYNPGGGTQTVTLQYDEIPNISTTLDRTHYPPNSQVFATIKDIQLNQDPTSRDSWTFNIGIPQAVFYGAFTESGTNAANGGVGLTNIISKLSSLGFEKNGKLSVSLGTVAQLQANGYQTATATDGTTTFTQIITFVESQPNSGIFENYDFSDLSNVQILSDAPRGQSANMEYNLQSLSIVSGLSDADISSGTPQHVSGQKVPITINDPDQNINPGGRDKLDVFRSSALIPSLTIGTPATLQNADSVKIYTLSTDALTGGTSVTSSVPDANSDRLILNTKPSTGIINQSFEKISLNTGLSALDLRNLLIQISSGDQGTNWINYDLRSVQNQLGITDYADTTISLSFGLTDATPVILVSPNNMTGAQGFIQLPNAAVNLIAAKSGTAFLVINFDTSNNSAAQGSISSETDTQPIMFDLFSFGNKNNKDIANGIYRFELQETTSNSATFAGTMEYTMANQLNQFDANVIATLRPIDENVKFFVNQRLIDEKGINVAYSDVAKAGITTGISSKTDIRTHSATISTTSNVLRFGHPVTIILKDPDLNLKSDDVDIYLVNNDPNSPNVDTVGKDGDILLEILIKDIRYKRCTVNGVEYGGLASSGFTLVETGPSTGVFEGTFKMPSQICDKSGTTLISPAGGSLDAKYHDSRDASGNPNIFSLLLDKSTTQFSNSPQLSTNKITIPPSGRSEEIILSGNIANHKRGMPLAITLTSPDGVIQNFAAVLSDSGSYRTAFSINENSLSGVYKIQLSHNGVNIGLVSFTASKNIPDWVKDNARRWSSTSISDSEFIDGLKQMIKDKIIVSSKESSVSKRVIPDWVKNNARWWSNDQISDDDFIKSLQYLVKKGIILV